MSAPTVGRLLRDNGFSLQGNAKVLEGEQHPDRDGQFRYISQQATGHQAAGEPVISVDTKKREQKRHPNKRVAATARQALSHLWQLPRESSGARRLNPRVTVEILLDDRAHARLPVNDTEIVDRAAYLRDLFAPQRPVYLVAGDYSMLFRSEELGLRPIQVPSQHR